MLRLRVWLVLVVLSAVLVELWKGMPERCNGWLGGCR